MLYSSAMYICHIHYIYIRTTHIQSTYCITHIYHIHKPHSMHTNHTYLTDASYIYNTQRSHKAPHIYTTHINIYDTHTYHTYVTHILHIPCINTCIIHINYHNTYHTIYVNNIYIHISRSQKQ